MYLYIYKKNYIYLIYCWEWYDLQCNNYIDIIYIDSYRFFSSAYFYGLDVVNTYNFTNYIK